jgi:hypothetical protein
MYTAEKVTDLEGYDYPENIPGSALTYPYTAPQIDPGFYSAPVPMQVDEPFNHVPIINDTVENVTIKTPLVNLTGSVVDSKTNKPISGVKMAFRILGEDKDLEAAAPLEGSAYTIEVDMMELPNYAAIFYADGYVPHLIPLEILADTPTVTMTPEKGFPIWMVLAVIAAVYVYRKQKKKVGALSMGDVFPIFLIVGGIIAFDIIKRILITLGIWDSKDTKELDDEAADPNSAWNPNFYKTKPSNVQWTYAITTSQADKFARDIYNAFGAFNDCEECVKGIIRQQRTKSNISYIAEQFQKIYGSDLLDFLRGGWWPQDRLSDSDVAELNRFIAQLPKY